MSINMISIHVTDRPHGQKNKLEKIKLHSKKRGTNERPTTTNNTMKERKKKK